MHQIASRIFNFFRGVIPLMRSLSIYCVSRTLATPFNPSTSAITDHCQSAKNTDTYFTSQLYVEDLSPPAMDGIRTHNFSIDNQCLPLGLYRSLQILKCLISGNGIAQTFWRSFPSTFPNPTCLYKNLGLQCFNSATVALKEQEKIMKSCFLLTASGDRIDSLIIIAVHKYILKNILSLYWENDRQISVWIVQIFLRIFFTNNLAIMSPTLPSTRSIISHQQHHRYLYLMYTSWKPFAMLPLNPLIHHTVHIFPPHHFRPSYVTSQPFGWTRSYLDVIVDVHLLNLQSLFALPSLLHTPLPMLHTMMIIQLIWP